MKLITSNVKLSSILIDFIKEHKRIQFAVAWATDENLVYRALKKNKIKIRKSVIGRDGWITKPNVLFEFVSSKKVKFIERDRGVFHPKIYLFETGKDWDLIVGSANMTSGGFGNNTETMVHISSSDGDERLYTECRAAIDGYWDEAEMMTPQRAENYLRLYSTHRAKNPQPSRDKKKSTKYVDTSILPMSWEEFFKKTTAVRKHTIEHRFNLLDAVNQSFANNPSMSDMSQDERHMIAGIRNNFNDYTGLFGSMDRAASAHNWAKHIDDKKQLLSDALDMIPSFGTIDKNSFQQYSKVFREATGYKNAVGTFTRLLAMKRPDIFVCLTDTNKQALCQDFGISRSTMTYEKYWDEIIERLTQSVWWNAPQPQEAFNLKVWNSRSALLDAIYYVP